MTDKKNVFDHFSKEEIEVIRKYEAMRRKLWRAIKKKEQEVVK